MDSITDILPNVIIDLLPVFILDRINLITFSFLLLICLILWGKIMFKAEALSSRDQKIDSLINQKNTLNNRINNYKNTISQLNAQINTGNQQYSQLYNQYIASTQCESSESNNQQIQSLTQANNKLKTSIRQLNTKITQLNNQITSGNEQYSILYNQNTANVQQIDSLSKQIKDLSREIRSLKNENHSLKVQNESSESNNQQIQSLTQANNKLKTSIRQLKTKITQLNNQITAGNEQYSILYNQNTANVQQIDSLSKQIKDLSLEIRSLKNENHSLKVINRTNDNDCKKLNLQIKTLQQKNTNLLNEYKEAIVAKEEAEKKLEEWKQESENEGNYNKKHAHPRDKNLTFDENEHKYFVGNKELKSVTSLVEGYFPPFEAERLAYLVGKKTGRNPQELIAEWDRKGEEARTLGTMMHENIEKFYLGEAYENNDVFGQFLDFTKNTHLVPYRTEWPIYDEEAGIAGTLDFLDYQNGEYIIYDWKRSKKVVSPKLGKPIVKSKNKTKGLRPITDIEDAPYWHYALQTSLYRYILKRDYGIDVAKSRLVVMHPELKQAFMTDVPYMEKEVIAILEDQKQRH